MEDYRDQSSQKYAFKCFLKAMSPRVWSFLNREGAMSLEQFLALRTDGLKDRQGCGIGIEQELQIWQYILKAGAEIKLACWKNFDDSQVKTIHSAKTDLFVKALEEYVLEVFSFDHNSSIEECLQFNGVDVPIQEEIVLDYSFFPVRARHLFSQLGISRMKDIVVKQHLIFGQPGIGESTEKLIKVGLRAQLYRDACNQMLEIAGQGASDLWFPRYGRGQHLKEGPLSGKKNLITYHNEFEKLDVRSQNILSHLGIQDVDGLLQLNEERLLEQKNCGAITTYHILQFKKRVLASCHGSNNSKTVQEGAGISLMKSSSKTGLSQDLFREIVDQLDTRSRKVLERLRVNTPEAFISLTRERLLNCENCGRLTVGRIILAQRTYMEGSLKAQEPNLKSDEDAESWGDISDKVAWLDGWLDSIETSHKAILAFKLRKGLMGQKPQTLANVGKRLGVSRERVRQYVKKIEKSAMKYSSQLVLRPLFNEVYERVYSNGGVLSFEELSELIWNDVHSASFFKHSKSLIELFARMRSWSAMGLRIDQEKYVSLENVLNIIDISPEEVWRTFKNNSCDFRDSETWSIELDQARVLLKSMMNENPELADVETVSKSLVEFLLSRLNLSMRMRGKRIYSEKYWNMKFGTMKELVETILVSRRGPVHFNEISSQVKEWRPKSKAERVISTLTKHSTKSLLWGRGLYVHRDYISIPAELMNEIGSWIEKRLDGDVPFVYVNIAFDEFKEDLLDHGIPSEPALYSCLREYANHRYAKNDASGTLLFTRYPVVFLKRKYNEKKDYSKETVVEEYLMNAGEEVSRRAFFDHWVGRVGMREHQINQVIAGAYFIIRTGDGGYIHVENFDYDKMALKQLAQQAEEIISTEGHCSAERLYTENIVSCRVAGIKSPQALFYLLRVDTSDHLLLRQYPKIEAFNEKKHGRNIGDYIEDYIRSKGRPCHYSELMEQFEKQKGYNQQNVRNIAYRPNISIYVPGCVVHLDTLNWGAVKQSQLEMLAIRTYESALESGLPYAKVDALIVDSGLPKLPKNLNWSGAMIIHLLQKGGRFIPLGNLRKIFVRAQNAHNISNTRDLLAVLLEIDGRVVVPRHEFEQFLLREGIIANALTPSMVKDSRVTLSEDHVFLKDD